ncbi:MAG: FixH family protein [Planctomycetota bacterium]
MTRGASLSRSLLANRWAFVPVIMLSTVVAAAVLVVLFAVNERGATAAEPDYYRKGAAWDDWKRQLALNGVLRWVVTPSIVPSTSATGLARLELTVADRHGMPIEGAVVRADVIPILDGDARVTLTLTHDGSGRYSAELPLRIGGQWEIRSTIEWRGNRFCDRVRRTVEFRLMRSDRSER